MKYEKIEKNQKLYQIKLNRQKQIRITIIIVLLLAVTFLILLFVKDELQSYREKIYTAYEENKALQQQYVKQIQESQSLNDNNKKQIQEIKSPIYIKGKQAKVQSYVPPSVSNVPTRPPNLDSNFKYYEKQSAQTVHSRAGITVQQRLKWVEYLQLKNFPLNSSLAQEEKQYYQQKYNISQYSQFPICVVVPSYNNVGNDRYINNMNAILQQDYSNYHIIFIDDYSDDGTGLKVAQYAQKHQISKDKLKVIINQKRIMALPNIYKAAHEFCKPYELLIIVDGDDELIGKQVFKFFNAVFQSKNVWLAYSNHINFKGSLGYSRPFPQNVINLNLFREARFTISHLRVFYTKLFTLIDQNDLKDNNGSWFRAANDVAMYIPMMEMAHKKMTYLPELTYMYNENTKLNNHIVRLKEQKGNEKIVKKKASYTSLDQLLNKEELEQRQKVIGRKIAIKDLSLPSFSGIQRYSWEQ